MIMSAAGCLHKNYNRQRPSLESAIQIQRPSFLSWTVTCLFLLSLSSLTEVRADDSWQLDVSEQELKEIADGALTLMSFQVLPDITTSSLSIQKSSSDNPGIWQTTFGGGFTLSKNFPLYLEGTLGYSRYDPEFIASSGQQEQSIPVKWNSFAATGGIGWDISLTADQELKLRPIFNFTLGHVATDASIAQDVVNVVFEEELDIIDDGTMNAYGLGGAIMLDYERYREDNEFDLEVRYTKIQLHTFGSTTSGLKGESTSEMLGVWSRWREPTGFTFLQRPLRYVLESSFTSYFGPQRGALGFNHLASVGAGFEIDTSAHSGIISRARLVGRYVFGDNVSGFSVGLAVSF
jgi:hypothetical protein